MKTLRAFYAAQIVMLVVLAASAQSANPQKPAPHNPPKPNDVEVPQPPEGSDIEKLKVDTNLVTVPVIASSRDGKYIADLTKEDFKISEDGMAQTIAFLATVNAPFHVVLMIDTSGSTREKLAIIQRAAAAFVDQLSDADKVKVISFDDTVRDWNDFTSNKAQLRGVITQTKSGEGTKVYDAMQMGLNALRPINGRRAIVLFTDGVDWHSDSSTFDGTLRDLDESGVIVYPIRFDTRAETERIARQQDANSNGAQLPTSDVIRGGTPSGSTPPTFPSDDPSPVPSIPRQRNSLPSIIFDRRRNPAPQTSPTDPFPDAGSRLPSTPDPGTRPGSTTGTARDDSITAMLNMLYLTADSYLKDLADKSGGQVYRADTLAGLPQAFAAIAAELRTQYLLGYYPTNRNADGSYRKIHVKTSRKDVAIRARPGYRARTGG